MKRISYIFILILSLSFSSNILAYELKGRVINSSNAPLAYVSVYLKDNPNTGTVTNSSGEFLLDLPGRRGVVIISFMGYKTMELKVFSIESPDSMSIVLQEQPIMLDEAIISNKKYASSSRRAMKDYLAKIRQQIVVDFASETKSYRVVSNYYLMNANHIVTFEEATGIITEMPRLGIKGSDSVRFDVESRNTYYDQDAKKNFKSSEGVDIPKRHADQANKFLKEEIVHRGFWGGNILQVFDNLSPKLKNWKIINKGDGTSYLVYTEKRNYLGVVKYELKINYLINTFTYNVLGISQSLVGSANIPFGYKLNEEQLALLNVFKITGDDVEKFRIKYLNAKIERNVIFKREKGKTTVVEKNVASSGDMSDRQGNTITMNNTAKVRVIDVLH